jgi:hypothetical protein
MPLVWILTFFVIKSVIKCVLCFSFYFKFSFSCSNFRGTLLNFQNSLTENQSVVPATKCLPPHAAKWCKKTLSYPSHTDFNFAALAYEVHPSIAMISAQGTKHHRPSKQKTVDVLRHASRVVNLTHGTWANVLLCLRSASRDSSIRSCLVTRIQDKIIVQ